tara:strand:- start:18 stop:158 length:141 start_codon:yes stop_codon:yes gene_type:complete
VKVIFIVNMLKRKEYEYLVRLFPLASLQYGKRLVKKKIKKKYRRYK